VLIMRFEVYSNPSPTFLLVGAATEERTAQHFLLAAPRGKPSADRSGRRLDWAAIGAAACVYALAFTVWLCLAK
jgi:hypothetical protein